MNAITIAVSVAVCWRARKTKKRKAKSAASFHIQHNSAYRGRVVLQRLGLAGGTTSYSYPVVDTVEPSNTGIIIRRNEAYGSRNSLFEECLETNYAKIVGDYETPGVGQCENNNSDRQTRPTDNCGEQWSQASCSLEYNEAYDAVTPQNNVYESLNTVNNSV